MGHGSSNLTGRAGNSEIFRAISGHDAGAIICFVADENVSQVGNLPDPTLIHDTHIEYFRNQIELATVAGVERI